MIYIHIPFCKQKCSYCNFHFSTSLQNKDSFLEALLQEMKMRKDELQNKTLKTLYFGGGSPSLLSIDELKKIMDNLLQFYDFDSNIEVTLEANPDDLSQSYLKELATTPINRLSIGVQSFFEADLQLMNRAHSSTQAESAIKRAQDNGLENISIDLIYGSPTATREIWRENLQKTIDLQVPHISSYALTVEPKTALQQWVKSGKVKAPNDAQQNEDFFFMSDFLKQNGFEHYEISNFAKPGFYSQHNSAYWRYQPYLGLGPSAHSYNGTDERSWNVSNNTRYIQSLQNHILPLEKEKLKEIEQYNEALMIGLRTMWGISEIGLKEKFSQQLLSNFYQDIQPFLENGKLILEEGFVKIPEKHWFMADGIASDLFLVE